jgi:hypothetical protein
MRIAAELIAAATIPLLPRPGEEGQPLTDEVIDARDSCALADPVTDREMLGQAHLDRTVRSVMWMDAFLSTALVVVCVIASPIPATVTVPQAIRSVIGFAVIVCAVMLAAFGVITAVALMLRLSAGQSLLPVDLRLPLPAPMRPAALTPHDQSGTKMPNQSRR